MVEQEEIQEAVMKDQWAMMVELVFLVRWMEVDF
jgi:hypothetical protein